MSLFKGNLDSSNMFTANDDLRGLRMISVSNIPAYIALEAGDGGENYMWWDDSANLRVHTSAPTSANRNTGGSVITGAANAGASVALDNLASVAISTSLVSDTDSTDDLGSSTIYWANAYLDKVLFNSTATMEGTTTAGVITIVGDIIGGATGTGSSFKFWATTAGGYIHWDDTANTNAGGLIFTDDAQAIFGDSSDFTIQWNASQLVLDNKTANTGGVVIGSAVATDLELHGTTATSDAGWDSSADTFQVCDDAILNIGGTGIGTMDGFKFWFVAADSDMYIDSRTANDSIVIGSGSNVDLEIHGGTANNDITWDASANAWTFLDATKLAFGSSDDVTIAYDGTDNEIDILQAVAGTGKIGFGKDDVGMDVKFYGATAGDFILWDESADTLVFEDTVLRFDGAAVNHSINISTNTLLYTATDNAAAKFTIGAAGGTNGLDFEWLSKTAGDSFVLDAGALTATFDDIDVTVLGKLTLGADADASNDDFKWFGTTTAKFVVFDESADDVIFADAVGLILGGSESVADGLKMEFDGTSTANIEMLTANDEIAYGATVNTDIRFNGATAGADFLWDASADAVVYTPATATGLGLLGIARAKYDFAVDGGVTGAITPASTAVIPNNAVIVGGTINSTTAVTSAGAATVSVGTTAGSSATSLLAATGKASLSADAVLNAVPVFATPVKMTAAGSINITVGTADLTAGVIEITLLYYVAAA